MFSSKDSRNKGISYCLILGFCLLCCFILDYTVGLNFVINDDLAMRDIASGARSGTPDGHLVYIKYPLGWLLSNLYRWFGFLGWYDILMVGVVVVCLSLVIYRIVYFVRSWPVKITIVSWMLLLFMTHIIEVQWTMCAAIAGSTAIFFYLTISTQNRTSRLCQKAVTVGLLLVCYLIRDKVFWLVAACGFFPVIYKEWKYSDNKKNAGIAVIAVFSCILVGVGCIEVVDNAAYASQEWEEYFQFNRARSLVYDYYGIPNYEDHAGFYEEEDISKETFVNLKKYALIYDPDINTENMTKIAEYSKGFNRSTTFLERAEDFWDYFMAESFAQLRLTLCILAVCIVLCCIKIKDPMLCAMCVGEIFTWLALVGYLIYKGRFPERIVFTICLILIFVGFSVLLLALKRIKTGTLIRAASVIMAVIGIVLNISAFSDLSKDSEELKYSNIAYFEIKEYAKEHSDTLFLLPSGSFAGYTDRVDFVRDENIGKILPTGGWLSKAPTTNQRLEDMGVTEIPYDFTCADVQVLLWSEASVDYITDSMTESLGQTVTCEIVDTFTTVDGEINAYRFVIG